MKSTMMRVAMMLLTLMTTTAWAQNTLVSHIDYCKGAPGSICIAGWVYDSDPNTKLSWVLGNGIEVFTFVSTDPDETFKDYDYNLPIPNETEYLVREDVNNAYGLNGKHGFKAEVTLFPTSFEDGVERTFYVKIYGKFNPGTGAQYHVLYSAAVTVRKAIGEGSEESPYIISDAGDWNAFADAIADADLNPFYANGFYQLAKDEDPDDEYDEGYDNTTAVTKMWGTSASPFTGHFDGKGQTLNVNLSGSMHVAPFAFCHDATIQNLTVGGTISATQYAGGIVGHGGSSTLTLQNCICAATISGFSNYAGGLMGWCDNLTLNLQNCLFKGSFSPASGGKYHPIALKNASATVTGPYAEGVYYVNNVTPSEELGDYIINRAKAFPVSTTEVKDTWDDPIVAADGITYYGVHPIVKRLPYSYGFETPLDEEEWTLVDCIDNTGIRGSDSTSPARNGNYLFGFWEDYHYEHPQYLISPQFDGLSSITVSFYYMREGVNSMFHFYPSAFQVGYSTTYPEIDAFTWDDKIDITSKGYKFYERTFPKGTKYIAIKWLYLYLGDVFLDDFSFTACNTPSPTHLRAIDVTEYTASPTWEAPVADMEITGYAYQYKKVSDADWSDEITVPATTTSATITGLSANTDYDFRVKAIYGEEESIYLPINFTTATELPYEFGFENGMERWSMVDCHVENTVGNDYLRYTGIRSYAKHDGEVGFQFDNYITDVKPQYLISPRFSGLVPLIMQFYFKDRNPDSDRTEKFCVGYSTTTSDISAFTWGNEMTAKNVPWTKCSNTFPAGTRYVAVKYTSTSGSSLFVDDFYVAEYSTFPKPDNLTAGSVTDTEATLTWTAPDANVARYAYQFRKATENTWSAEETVSTTTITLSGLTENTTYYFRVKALGENNTASNYVSIAFITEGGVVSLPYTDGFENGMGGWRLVDGDPSSGIMAISSPHGGSYSFHFYRGSSKQYLVSPHFSSDTPILMTFYARNDDPATNWFSYFKMGYMGRNRPGETIMMSDWIKVSGAQWTKYSILLPADTEQAVICCEEDVDILYLDDFTFTAIPQIEFADDADNGTVITYYRNEMVCATLQGRTLYRDGEWNTLTLPFDVSNFRGTPLEGATVKTLSSADFDNGTLTLTFSDDLTAMDAGKPYIVKWANAAHLAIFSEEDWIAFAESVEAGNTYAGKTVQLCADISTSRMVGTAAHPFSGIFEGGGKTITFNISNGGEGAAPFHYINGATIKNVATIGTVTGGNHSAGLVGFASGGTNTIHNCLVETDVNVSTGGYNYAGGILGHGTSSATTIRDCMYNGVVHGHDVGMIYGWGDAGGTHTIENCMQSGLCYGQGDNYVIDLMRVDAGGTCNVINCYKYQNVGTQGTYMSPMNDETQLAEALGEQWTVGDDKSLVIRWKVTTAGYTNIVNPEFQGVTISDATANVETTYLDFVGTYSPVTYNNEDKSVLFLGGGSNLYYPDGTSATTIGACRAYFTLNGITAGDKDNEVKAFVLNFDGERPTLVSLPSGREEADAWYDLSGRKLDGKPTKAGIYIHNGKKVIIK